MLWFVYDLKFEEQGEDDKIFIDNDITIAEKNLLYLAGTV
jgi:hypothetical protein